MSLLEFVPPVVTVVSIPALAYIAARCLGLVVRAFIVLVVSIVAIKTSDEARRKASLSVLDKVTRREAPPPWSRHRPIDRGRGSLPVWAGDEDDPADIEFVTRQTRP
jgi:hypothetical protein